MRGANEELLAERRQLMEAIDSLEEQNKTSHKKQKYSFEVLCDFIYDKAKRLFTKYENVSKDKKVMQEEKNFYF